MHRTLARVSPYTFYTKREDHHAYVACHIQLSHAEVPIRQLEVNADVLTDILFNSYVLSSTKPMSDVTS